jgi:hypothetical protein
MIKNEYFDVWAFLGDDGAGRSPDVPCTDAADVSDWFWEEHSSFFRFVYIQWRLEGRAKLQRQQNMRFRYLGIVG